MKEVSIEKIPRPNTSTSPEARSRVLNGGQIPVISLGGCILEGTGVG